MIWKIFARKKIITKEKIMDAPEGILILYEINNPEKAPANAITTETNMMFLKFLVNKLAMDCGIVKSEITKIIPTTLMLSTIVKATRLINR